MRTVSDNIPLLSLEPDEVHLWLAFPDEIVDEGLISAYEQLLTPQEKERQGRLRFLKHRHQYLITRALVRTMLSRFTGIDPAGMRFRKNRYGKPELVLSKENPKIRFNISHTEGLIACGVVLDRDIGVDTENIKRKEASLGIADRFFSSKEVKDLRRLPEEEKRDRFYDYWTLKESYIKARGKGLSLSLGQFTFHLSDDAPLKITFDPRLKDHSEHWRFWLLRPTHRHKAAVSVHSKGMQDYSLTIKKVVPMVAVEEYACEVLKSY